MNNGLLTNAPQLPEQSVLCFNLSNSYIWKSSEYALEWMRPKNIETKATRFPWIWPAAFLCALFADLLFAFWILMEYFCVQVADPTEHSTGCSHVRLIVFLFRIITLL